MRRNNKRDGYIPFEEREFICSLCKKVKTAPEFEKRLGDPVCENCFKNFKRGTGVSKLDGYDRETVELIEQYG